MRISRNKALVAGAGVAALAGAAVAGTVATVAVGSLLLRAIKGSSVPENAVVLITGGSRGLGLAMAKRFARRPVRLVLVARNRAELQAAQDAILAERQHVRPEDFYLIDADLLNTSECRRVIDETIARFGRIDVLINNAGIIEVGPLESQPLDAFDRALKIYYVAPLHLIWAALPHMRSQEKLPGGKYRARIVNISSIGGKVPVPHLLPYVGGKFALTGLSEGLHMELRKDDIRVTTVCPGLMRTGGEDHARFYGQEEKEAAWFKTSGKTPGLSASVNHAANRIYNAVAMGCAEITITPQAWLAARKHGMWPSAVQFAGGMVNQYILPGPPKQDNSVAGESQED